jgi:replicative DNA helicase
MSPSDLRVPPHSRELEQTALGAILLDNRAWDRGTAALNEADFYSAQHRQIFAAIAALLTTGQTADVITVFERLRSTGSDDSTTGGLEYLNALAQQVPSAAHARTYASRLRKISTHRQLVALAGESLDAAHQAIDAVEVAGKIAARFGELELRHLARAPRAFAEVAFDRAQHHVALQEGRVAPGWSTGFAWADQRLNGGVRGGGLYILAARPAVGKSAIALAISLTLAGDGHPVLFCSLEMAEGEVADRAIANLGRIRYGSLLTGTMDAVDWQHSTEAIEALSHMPFHVDDEPALTLRSIRAKARSIKGLKVLVIDYLQLMAGTRRDGNRNAEIEEISRGLKALAKELDIAVIALSQLNRDVEKRTNKRPGLSDLRDSGAIEQDADVVMFLWPVRDFTESEGRKILGLGIDKNRQGRLGEVGLDFWGDYQRCEQSTADIRPMAPSRGGGGDL